MWEIRPAMPPVVVGTDLSEGADEALRQAGAWAQRLSAPLVVVHVASEPLLDSVATNAVTEALEKHVASVIPDPAELEIVLQPGAAHGGLIHAASERNASLLVVGASGFGTVGQAVFGSTTEQVVRYAEQPVLVARSSPEDGEVLAATDFSDAATPAVRAAADEAMRRGVGLTLLHSTYEAPSPLSALGPMLFSPPRRTDADIAAEAAASQSTLQTLLESTGATGECVVTHSAPRTAICETAAARGASLVVVGTHGRTGLKRVALGSVAEVVARSAPCSALVVRLAD